MDLLNIKQKNSEFYYFKVLGRKFSENLFINQHEGKFGIIDLDFKIIVPPKFEEIQSAYQNHFWGKINSEWNLYHLSQAKINSNPFQQIESFTIHFACVSANGVEFGFVDRKGKWEIGPRFEEGKYLGMNIFVVRKFGENFYNLIDNSGRKISSKNFVAIPTFSEIVLWQLKTRKPLKQWLKL